MSSIDKRIVQMQFDNQNFESGVSKTMQSLKNLDNSLKMKGATDGLNEVDNGIKKLSSSGLSGLSSGVQAVTSKFSALQVMGVTALANITNSAVNAGKNLIKSLTIEPITTGFSEYETKMGAIQTILTNTAHQGTTIKDVNKVLDELNTYADKTIYNFAEMTKNIGTFTAAGVDLDTSTAAIKGIANLAAASGSTSQQASTAMYQLSQALAAGKVSLADWNSVVNAGMGGKLFQDALIRTSEVMGTGAEAAIKKFGSFRESLTKGEWLTNDVLVETLKQISGAYTEADLVAQGYSKNQAKAILEMAKNAEAAATEVKTFTQLMDTMKESVQSGWAQTWEHIIGNKDEAKELFTSISKGFEQLIKPSMDARNEMFKTWKELGGRDDVIAGLGNIAQSVIKAFSAVGKAWREVFPSMTGEKLAELSEKFKNFTEKIKMNDEVAGKIKDTFKGVFNVFKTVGSAIGGVLKGFSPLLGVIKPIGSGILTVTSNIGKFITKISEAVAKTNIFTKIGEGLKTAFESIGKYISDVGDKISDFIGKLDFSSIGSFLSGVLSGIGGIISTIGGGISKALGTINFDTLTNLAKSLIGLGIFKTLKNIFDEFKGAGEGLTGVFESFKGIGENVKGILDSTKESLTAWQNSLNAKTLMKLAGAIAILAASLVVLASIEPGRLASALAGMGGLFAELSLAMLAINKIGNIKGLIKTSTGMILISTAILILSSAMKSLSGLNIGEVMTGLVSMAGLLGVMAAAVKMFSRSSSGLIKTSAGLIVFGAAMHVMASALKQLGEIDAETLGGGLFALAGVLVELAAFLSAAKFGNLSVGTATGILILSAALVVLAQAFKQFGSFNPDQIKKALAGIGGVLAEIAVFSKLGGSGAGMIALATGVTIMGAAMLVMAKAVSSMGSMKWDEIGRGLTSMAGALVIIGAASKLISGGQMMLVSVGVGMMSAALLVLGAALQSLGSMSWGEIAKSLVTLAGALVILGVAMYAMSGAILGAGAMLVMAGALAVLTPQLVILGSMSLGQIGIALLALAGAFTVLGVAGLLLTPISPVIALLGAAVALLGVGCLAAGVGVTAMATAFGLFAATVSASGAAVINFIKEIITVLPQLGLKFGEMIINMAGAIATGGPQLVAAFTTLIGSILTSIGTLIPKFVDTGIKMTLAFAEGLAKVIPQLVEYGYKLVIGVLEGISANIGKVVTAGLNCVINFMDGISANIGRVIQSGINLALSFIEGVADGLNSNQGRLEAAIRNLINAIIKAGLAVIKGSISGFTSGGKQLINGFINGIKGMVGSAGSAVKNVVNAAKKAASNLGSSLVGAGKSLIEGFVSGIKEKAASVAQAAKDVVSKAIDAAKSALKINSPSKVFIAIGGSVNEGFAKGLNKYSNESAGAATNLANTVIDTVSNSISRISDLINGDIDSQPVISPVMDLSNVKEGSRTIGQLLSSNSDLALATNTTGSISSSIGRIQNGTDNSDIVSALKDLKNSINNSNGNTYQINGITYDDGSNVVSAVETLVRAAKIERRI